MVRVQGEDRKRKYQRNQEEDYMNTPITFPPIPADDVSDEPLKIEVEVEGYLRTIYSDGKNRIECNVQERRVVPKNHDEVHCAGREASNSRKKARRRGTQKQKGTYRRGGLGQSRISGAKGYHQQAILASMPILVDIPAKRKQGLAQKRRVLGLEKSKAVMKEVEEWVKAGIMRPIRYSTWISNPVPVNKVDGTWRMCIDFKNVNSACPKDYYPLPKIDLKIEAVMGFPIKCFLDAYKGVNMKLNPKKCSFRVKDGKFLGYMATLEGIRANPKKTKAVADMQSPRTLKETQSLSGKLAALNRFLSKFAERALPFFKTLKNITKENKDDYQWTEDAEPTFQEMKKLILELPTLTTPGLKEMLYVYLVASKDAISEVLVADRKGKQMPIRYVSRTLYEAERNYASLEKLALCLLHDALLAGLRIAARMKVRALKVKVDSKLEACQLNEEFVASSEGMTKYLTKAKEYMAPFKRFLIENIP
ncbi:reverse transcriptase domain-containing protein [Tanacetum coccineum]